MDSLTKMVGQILLKNSQDKTNVNRNFVLSPLSYNAALHMVAPGASGNTLEQFLLFLGARDVDDLNSNFSQLMRLILPTDGGASASANGDAPSVAFLNSAWVHDGFVLDPTYSHTIHDVYKCTVKSADFINKFKEVIKDVNKWAASATKGLVKNVISKEDLNDLDDPPNTRIFLVNALYFKGTWVSKFEPDWTTNKTFYLLNGEQVSAPFMTGCSTYEHKSYADFQVVRIPYKEGINKNRKFSMYIYLPEQRDGLPSLLERLHDPKFIREYSKFRGGNVDYLWIPKFKFSFKTLEAMERMINMGLNRPFDPKSAEFRNMVVDEDGKIRLLISRVIHKAFIEVDESGTKAAAVTEVSDDDMGFCLDSPPPTYFMADHPFAFLIKEEVSGSIFFFGVVMNPLSE